MNYVWKSLWCWWYCLTLALQVSRFFSLALFLLSFLSGSPFCLCTFSSLPLQYSLITSILSPVLWHLLLWSPSLFLPFFFLSERHQQVKENLSYKWVAWPLPCAAESQLPGSCSGSRQLGTLTICRKSLCSKIMVCKCDTAGGLVVFASSQCT